MLFLQLRSFQKELQQMKRNLSSFVNEDQLRMLKKRNMSKNRNRGCRWSTDTIQKSLNIRYAVGKKGYEYLRVTVGYPLPAYRTLCEHMKDVPLHPGVQEDFIQRLGEKISTFGEYDAVLMLDEMQTRKCLQFDKGLGKFLGNISPELSSNENNTEALANHVLVLMARGITVKWKQIVAYFFTGESVSGEKLWDLIKKVINLMGEKKIHVRAVVSDMGAANRAMWACVGIGANRSNITNSIPHPFFSDQRLCFLADIPHLLKNIRNCLLSNTISLPNDVIANNALPSDFVSIEPVRQLVKLQDNSSLKLAPCLTANHVLPGTYEKMKVSIAAQVLSHTTASAIRFLVEHGSFEKSCLPTAWFLDLVNNWFDVCNSRCFKSALFDNSAEKVNLLHSVIDIFTRFEVRGRRSGWKPIQTGVLISTKSILELHESLVCRGNFKYMLTSRFTQDSLENLFSQVRGFGDSHPAPVHLRYNIRLICVAQFLQIPKHTSYEHDDDKYLLNFLNSNKKTMHDVNYLETVTVDPIVNNMSEFNEDVSICYEVQTRACDSASISSGNSSASKQLESATLSSTGNVTNVDLSRKSAITSNLSYIESNALCYVSGWVCFKLKPKLNICKTCTDALVSPHPCGTGAQHFLSKVSYGKLVVPNNKIFMLLEKCEKIFRSDSQIINQTVEKLVMKCENVINTSDLPTCHRLAQIAVAKYIKLRLHIYATNKTQLAKIKVQHGSKSAKARTLIK